MKIALIGTGRTGGKVLELIDPKNITYFDSDNPPTAAGLAGHDAAICFLPGPAFLRYIDIILESGVPLACGSTGFDWPEDIDARLKAKGVAWVAATNFALGMNLVQAMIGIMAKAPSIYDDYGFKLHEIHHVHKKDHPSGTALTWQKWLGQDVEFSFDREGDNPGDHKLTLEAPYENIIIQHQSKDRKIFAQGAIWTAEKLASKELEPGLHHLATIMQSEFGLKNS